MAAGKMWTSESDQYGHQAELADPSRNTNKPILGFLHVSRLQHKNSINLVYMSMTQQVVNGWHKEAARFGTCRLDTNYRWFPLRRSTKSWSSCQKMLLHLAKSSFHCCKTQQPIQMQQQASIVRVTPKPASSMAHSTVTRALALWAHT